MGKYLSYSFHMKLLSKEYLPSELPWLFTSNVNSVFTILYVLLINLIMDFFNFKIFGKEEKRLNIKARTLNDSS